MTPTQVEPLATQGHSASGFIVPQRMSPMFSVVQVGVVIFAFGVGVLLGAALPLPHSIKRVWQCRSSHPATDSGQFAVFQKRQDDALKNLSDLSDTLKKGPNSATVATGARLSHHA